VLVKLNLLQSPLTPAYILHTSVIQLCPSMSSPIISVNNKINANRKVSITVCNKRYNWLQSTH